jgi:Uma2 family endonuclease
MVAEPRPPRWSVEDYLEMERASTVRHEFLGGYVYAMAGGTQLHSRISVRVTALLLSHLRGKPCGVFNSDMKVRIDAQDFVYPDAVVDCDPRDLEHQHAAFLNYPLLIAEVLSDDSTADYDRGDKFYLLYARLPSLRDYILIETGRIGIEVRRRQQDGTWTITSYGPGDLVTLESIDGQFPISEFYL